MTEMPRMCQEMMLRDQALARYGVPAAIVLVVETIIALTLLILLELLWLRTGWRRARSGA